MIEVYFCIDNVEPRKMSLNQVPVNGDYVDMNNKDIYKVNYSVYILRHNCWYVYLTK